MTPCAQEISHRVASVREDEIVIEERRREDEAVGAVEGTAVSGQQPTHVLEPEIALQGRDREPAEAAEEPECTADEEALAVADGREVGREQCRRERRRAEAADVACNSLVRTESRDGPAPAKSLAGDILHDVADLAHEDEKQQQARSARDVAQRCWY